MLCRCVDCLWALHFQSKAENSVLAYAAPPPGSHPETLAGGLAESGQEYLSICTDRMLRGIMEMRMFRGIPGLCLLGRLVGHFQRLCRDGHCNQSAQFPSVGCLPSYIRVTLSPN